MDLAIKIFTKKHFIFISILILTACGANKEIPFTKLSENLDLITIAMDAKKSQLQPSDSRFSELAEFISKQESGWGTGGVGTFPTPEISISFYSQKELKFPLWIESDWIRTRIEGKSYSKNVSPEELDQFKNLCAL